MDDRERKIAWNFAVGFTQLHADELEAEGYSKEYVSNWVEEQIKEFESQYD